MVSRLVAILSLTLLVLPAQAQRLRCGTPALDYAAGAPGDGPTDCGYLTNKPQSMYDPTFLYHIPVVFHVIQNTAGNGRLNLSTLQDQIDILNEDFQAIAGSPGAPGTNGMIRFHLATEDPGGKPTNGVTYTTNNNWYNDNGKYWNTLAWDTNRYLNIYTNAVPCCYGYISLWASRGAAGKAKDRVVLWWEAVGRKPTNGWPKNMGRTATHEVGHYLGLYHTFDGGCGTASNCYGTGDLICDTNMEAKDTTGCPTSKSSCGNSDPIHNYMDYSDDPCLWEFTPEQVNRMRCTLVHWRPKLFSLSANATSLGTGCIASGQPPALSGTPPVLGKTAKVSVRSAPQSKPGMNILGAPHAGIKFGPTCVVYVDLGLPIITIPFLTDGTGSWQTPAISVGTSTSLLGTTVGWQAGIHDPATVPFSLALTNGLRLRIGR
ncbi:MAG: zinc metalloprotease [Planctomycetota bacterium]|nr:zinc metalloprotease [Planctomycetota bacterium]